MAEKTLGDLYKTKDITEDELTAAVAAFVAKPVEGEHQIGKATLDIAAAVAGHPYAKATMAHEEASGPAKRAAVRTAVLLSVPKAK